MAVSWIPFAFPVAAPAAERVRCAFQMRAPGSAPDDPLAGGNVSFDVGDDPARVAENRRALQRALGFAGWQEARQVHGADVLLDPPPAPEDPARAAGVAEADGLATDRPGQALAIKTADCQPVLLAHLEGRHVAALHVGWRGNRVDFPLAGVAAFCERYGLSPADVLAVRGPSLGPGAAEFVNFEQDWGEAFRPWHDPRARTRALTRDQLVRAGLRPEHVFGLDLCTRTLPAFFSHRRDPRSGRQASLIWMV
jgi:hypothetical protein